jgi:hypothetical protein
MHHFAQSLGGVVGLENVAAGLVGGIARSTIRRADRSHDLSAVHDHSKHYRISPPEIVPDIAYNSGACRNSLVIRDDYDRPPAIAIWLPLKMLRRTRQASLNRAEPRAFRSGLGLGRLLADAPFRRLKIAGEVQNQLGSAVAGGRAEGYGGDVVAWAKIAQNRMRRLGDSPHIRTHFAASVEDQYHIQRLFFAAKGHNCPRLSLIRDSKVFPSEIRNNVSVLTNLNVHMDQRNVASESRLTLGK